jgi:hypothetical protein
MTVIVNNLTIVHQASGGVSTAFPDVCKTPSGAGPIPIPYPNTAMSADTAQGSQTVKADGHPFMLRSSCFVQSTGDEPGSAGGVVSGKIKGKAYPKMYSFDVKVEGENVFRNTDLMLQNGGSPTNTPPAPIMQPNQVGGGKGADLKNPHVVSLAWEKKEAWCGDEVGLKVETKDTPDGRLTLFMYARGEQHAKDGTVLDLKGNKGEDTWVAHRGQWQEKVELELRHGHGKGEVKSGALEVKAPEAAKEVVGPVQRTTPEYRLDELLQLYLPTGRNYGWEMYYEIELKQGELVITRPVPFNLRNGATQPSPEKIREWKREIESIWDKKFVLHRKRCKREDRCTCRIESGCCRIGVRIRAELGVMGGGVKKIDLLPGANDPNGWGKVDKWWYSHTWWMEHTGVSLGVRAHEFGHLIGMYDEYPAGACDPARRYTDEHDSIMNSGSQVFERHFEDFKIWAEKKFGAGFGETVMKEW